MTDTIELLEAIGSDALLRHAPAVELVAILHRLQASDALKQAAACGDSSALSRGLGRRPMQAPNVVQIPGHEEDEPAPDEEDAPTPPPSLLA